MDASLKKNLCEQVAKEWHSAYIYRALSSRMKDQAFDGFANWMNVQAQEEMAHARHMLEYLEDRSEQIDFSIISQPAVPEALSPLDAMRITLEHEIGISASINALMGEATRIDDFATTSFLLWYVNEQVEEETTAKNLLDKCTRAKDSDGAMMMLDNELSTRTFTDPFANTTA